MSIGGATLDENVWQLL